MTECQTKRVHRLKYTDIFALRWCNLISELKKKRIKRKEVSIKNIKANTKMKNDYMFQTLVIIYYPSNLSFAINSYIKIHIS